MDPDIQKKWKDAMETAKLTGGGGGNGVDTANIMLGESVSVRAGVFLDNIFKTDCLCWRWNIIRNISSPAQCPESHKEEVEHNQANTVTR